jgi:hypothetical protein
MSKQEHAQAVEQAVKEFFDEEVLSLIEAMRSSENSEDWDFSITSDIYHRTEEHEQAAVAFDNRLTMYMLHFLEKQKTSRDTTLSWSEVGEAIVTEFGRIFRTSSLFD